MPAFAAERMMDLEIEARPYLWIDATYLKEREGGRIVSAAAIIAVGVNTDGRREVLGVATGPSEAEPFLKAFLRSLEDRGLRGVKLVHRRRSKRAARRGQQSICRNAAALPGALNAQRVPPCRAKTTACRHCHDQGHLRA